MALYGVAIAVAVAVVGIEIAFIVVRAGCVGDPIWIVGSTNMIPVFAMRKFFFQHFDLLIESFKITLRMCLGRSDRDCDYQYRHNNRCKFFHIFLLKVYLNSLRK